MQSNNKNVCTASAGAACEDPPLIDFGEIVSGHKSGYKESDRVQYLCNPGYTLSGSEWHPIFLFFFLEIVCSPPRIPNGNFRPQDDNYVVGDTITIQCNPGYHFKTSTGKSTAECTKNGWVPDPGCVQKPCDYPAIENGKLSGRLEYYKDYYFPMRFGQHADYHCNDGYLTPSGEYWVQMVCSERGWSPEPKCLKKCHVRQLENGYFSHSQKTVYKEGERVKYLCNDDYHTEHEDGEVTCTKDDWSPPPRCIRKSECACILLRFLGNTRGCGPPPEITNGSITGGSVEQYQHGDRKQYECNIEFKLVGSKEIECVDGQWSSPPSCIEDKIPCGSPSSIPNVVLHQEDQTQFSHGDVVICGCKQGSGNPKEMKIKCLNGEWKPLPLCADPSPQCVLPMDVELVHNGRLPNSKKETGFHGVIRYTCTSADRSIKQATCVSGKWSPEIECTAEESTCPPPPQVPGAQQITVGRTYKHGSKIAFSCLKSFQLIGVNEITCIEGKWQSPPQCVERPCLPPQPVECADVPRLENQNLKIKKEGKTIYLAGARFKYVSRPGYTLDGPSEITCSMGNWTSAPTCLEMPCGSIPKVANAQIEGRNKEMYEPGETIRYQCDAGFLIVGPPEIICREGNWTAPPFCEDVSCGAAPEIPNAYITSAQQGRYLPGARVQYECESNFQMMGGNYVTCTNGEWSRAPTCRDVTCEPPPEIAGGKVQGVKKSRYLPGESAQYHCWQGFQMTGASTVACQNGTWTELPQCKGKGGKCGPPPVIENGDLLSFPMQEYPRGTTLEYKCPSLYVLEGSQHITCTDGQWTSPPVCLVACTASEDDMDRNNIELKWVLGRKLYSRSGDFIEFRCKRGYLEDAASPAFRAQCMEGTLEYPRCKPGKNCTVRARIMEKNNIQLQSSSRSSTSTYRSGDFIFFECKRWYQQVSHPETFRAECLDGVINYPTCEWMFARI
ncbi:complement factor H-like [Nyctibius grandis]|uniref:complement factor H-like n=1 Tax=Nyctibius grandis TaxID=48427 RepID=UPI0035BBEB81